MAESIFHGPVVSLGGLMNGTTEPFDGPNIQFQGDAFPDPRFTPAAKDGLTPSRIPCFAPMQSVVVTDTIVSKTTATSIVSAASATAGAPGTLMPLNATTATAAIIGSQTYAASIPIIPLGTTSVVTVSAIDFGFTTGTTAANSSTVIVADSSLFTPGAYYVIGGAGSSTNKLPLITQVATVTNATTIKISPVALGALAAAPIARGNAFGADLVALPTQFGPSLYSANAASVYTDGGLGAVFDARAASARGIRVVANTVVSGTSGFTVTGYDVYGALMTETMTALNATTPVYGYKAFKYISSITSLGTGAATFQFGQSDVFGVHLRAETYDVTEINYAGITATNANGFTGALLLSAGPSTGITGDVRGTWQLSTTGNIATSVQLAPTDGTSRLYMVATPRVANLLKTGPGTFTSNLFGVAQA